ncbi:MAG: hypothetical protein EBX59_09375, partial [Betaproteobacteria bacterium]|nr:hypothetical protein [Betaproteobacteria bacterium]
MDCLFLWDNRYAQADRPWSWRNHHRKLKEPCAWPGYQARRPLLLANLNQLDYVEFAGECTHGR